MYKGEKKWIFVVIILLITGYYFFLNPYEQEYFFISCPFYKISGYQCSGCGSQRAFHEILHLNFEEAFHQNALVLLGIPYFSLIFFTSFCQEKFAKLRQFLIGKKTILILFIFIILFGIFRNL
ncbi:DUF2752 domain-containing protein [Cloacibacterium normanense]|uniref:DUF2752 domain-containing protein n=1 Tax=Cloacibacterium normanense TaxID=237258 RepID=A0A1E5UBG5_9FLAO|nr:DUF2752 domain-containing protein [Cloacibacterium normanense]OEL10256.1 hypothetical protein BHF72_0620 [Cloacibacterium normanense]SDO33958.1 Protein of unknown function [Cloacibacterium normanense]